jgi:DNA-binding protein H-NS
MAKISLAKPDVNALLKLREDIGVVLSRKADELKGQLARLSTDVIGKSRRGSRASALRGRKVAPKYRDPATGDTWAGRGAKPRWLVARLKEGKKLPEFLIDKSAAMASKGFKERRRSKR